MADIKVSRPPKTTMRPQPGWRNMPTIEVTHKELRDIGTMNNLCSVFITLFGVGIGGAISFALALSQGTFLDRANALMVALLGLSIFITLACGIVAGILIHKSHRDVEEIWKERRFDDEDELASDSPL